MIPKLFSTVLLFIVVYITLVAHIIYAFDNERKGFILGLGGGLHHTSMDYQFTDDISTQGLSTSFRIGGAFNEKWMLYYMREAAFYSIDKKIYASGLMGIGFSYYFQENPTSWYLIGGIGIGDYTQVTYLDSYTGKSFLFGVGYEIKKRIMIEGKLLYTSINDRDPNKTNILNSISPIISINYLWY